MRWTGFFEMIIPLVLAAGRSERMGSPKALLDFGGRLAIEVILDLCRRASLAAPVVVLGHEPARVQAALPSAGLTVVENPDYARGQSSSIQAGMKALPKGAEGFLLWPVDMPLVADATVAALLAVWEKRPAEKQIVVPMRTGRRGHPAIYGAAVFPEFMRLRPDEPGHAVIRKDPARVLEIPVDDPWVLFRMDTPEEYQVALAEYQRRPLHL